MVKKDDQTLMLSIILISLSYGAFEFSAIRTFLTFFSRVDDVWGLTSFEWISLSSFIIPVRFLSNYYNCLLYVSVTFLCYSTISVSSCIFFALKSTLFWRFEPYWRYYFFSGWYSFFYSIFFISSLKFLFYSLISLIGRWS